MVTPKPTPAQRRAADPARSVWVTANAGTGKTAVLTDRVLRLLLAGAPAESILCLTFTKAAAAEMIGRVERRLAGWATMPEAQLGKELDALTGTAPTSVQLDRARQLFARVLELPRSLPIMTIHALCGSLLRRFPIESGVAPHFETIDDRTARELMQEARAAMLADAADAATSLGAAVQSLAVTLTEQSLTEALDQVLWQRVRIARLVGDGGIDSLVDRVWQRLGAERGVEPPLLIEAACRDEMLALNALRAAAEACARGSAADCERGAALTRWLALSVAGRIDIWPEYKAVFLAKNGSARAKLATQKVLAAAREALLAEQCRICAVEERIRALMIARRTEALLRVGWAVIQHYVTLKAHRAGLDFDDLIERTCALLVRGGEWVMFKLDERIEHLLVDEAQDTSPAQWEIIERLSGEFFAGAGQHDRPRTLFVVGDEKQSIYSFQGADLANLRAVRERLRARAGPAWSEETLDISFRSTPAVLEVVDAVLALPEARAGVVTGDAVVRHGSARPNDAGLVELWPLAAPPEKEPDAEPWPLPGEPRAVADPEREVAGAVAGTIRRWLDGGERLASTGRLIGPGDIMILMSRRGRLQEELIRALKRNGIPVAGADRLGLTSHIAVRDLVALGRTVLLPEDDLTFACLLKSPLVGLDDDDLLRLAAGRGAMSLHQRLRTEADGHVRLASAWRRVADWQRRADFMPPFEFYCHVLGEKDEEGRTGRCSLLARLGREAAEPIEAFLGQCLAYEEGHPASLEWFLHWLELGDEELKRDAEAAGGAVRVLTVHGAKGLEAPIVLLADAGPHGRAPADRLLWDNGTRLPLWRPKKVDAEPVTCSAMELEEAQLEDERRRLLYVALTRARDRLYIAGRQTSKLAACWHTVAEAALGALTAEAVPGNLGSAFVGQALRYARGAAAEAKDEPAVAVRAPELPGWAHQTAHDQPVSATPLAPSRLLSEEGGARVAGAQAAARIRRGNLIHKLLELLPALQEETRPAAANRWLTRTAPELDAGARAALVREVQAVIDMPELAPAFAPGSRAEQPICGMLRGRSVNGQIDRLAVTDSVVLVVDYKTGGPPLPDLTATPAAYVAQMAAYRDLLRDLWPGRSVRCGLLWTEEPRLDLLPDALLDTYLLSGAAAPAALTAESGDT